VFAVDESVRHIFGAKFIRRKNRSDLFIGPFLTLIFRINNIPRRARVDRQPGVATLIYGRRYTPYDARSTFHVSRGALFARSETTAGSILMKLSVFVTLSYLEDETIRREQKTTA